MRINKKRYRMKYKILIGLSLSFSLLQMSESEAATVMTDADFPLSTGVEISIDDVTIETTGSFVGDHISGGKYRVVGKWRKNSGY